VTKRAAEEGLLSLAAETPMRVTILRPCVVTGAGQRGGVLLKLFRLCRRGLFPVFGGRIDVQKPLVAVADLVQALLRAGSCDAPSGIYLVTSGERHSLREILTVAGRLVGRDRPFRSLPLSLARLGAGVTTPLARALGLDPPLSPARLDLFLADRAIDIARARTGLGYAPEHTALEPMLAETHAWYRESGQL
jgi:nucleoside-diphosphate-sugar epimerase